MQTIASFRKASPGILASAALALRDDVPQVTKAEVASILKRCAGRLGIKGYAYQILDMLLAISSPDDWRTDRRPVVAVSNGKAAFDLGVSEKTITRALRSLVEAGIIAYRDSPTGRRFVNGEGEAYGLDFSPARQRYAELAALASAHGAEWRSMRETIRRSQSVARQIVDALEQLVRDGHNTTAFEKQFNALIVNFHERRADPDFVQELMDLLIDVLQHYQTDEQEESDATHGQSKETNMSPAQDNSVPLYTDTTPPNSVKEKRNRASARSLNKYDIGSADRLALEKKPVRAGLTAQDLKQAESPDEIAHLLRLACRQLKADWGISAGSWAEMEPHIDTLRGIVQIPAEAWLAGVKAGGRINAAAAIAIVAEKMIRAAAGLPGGTEIRRPARYFLSMLYRSETGELNLLPSLRALAKSGMN
ncbi:MAG: hypothetical protein E6Q76_09195 [Rhizobium sp.]|nr:MAG: hypothetical protein E6Q76_09195 [Rhizobium sp.]